MTWVEPFAGLVREHERIAEAVAEARSAAEAAAQYPDDADLVPTMIAGLLDLQAFMATELALHIAKEEQVLFPAFRDLAGEVRLVDELMVQHDRVREREALLRQSLAALDHDHHEVEDEAARLDACLARAGAELTPDVRADLVDIVRRLDWILQGHFSDEEDDMFAPGATLFSADVLADLGTRMDALAASP